MFCPSDLCFIFLNRQSINISIGSQETTPHEDLAIKDGLECSLITAPEITTAIREKRHRSFVLDLLWDYYRAIISPNFVAMKLFFLNALLLVGAAVFVQTITGEDVRKYRVNQ